MKNKTKYVIIIVLLICSIIASVILSVMPLEQACGEGIGSGSCVIVQTSKYETTLGIKNAHIGLIAFPVLTLLAFLEIKRPRKYQKTTLTLGIIAGSIFALYFLFIQFFVLKAICKYCMVVDIAVLGSLLLTIFGIDKK